MDTHAGKRNEFSHTYNSDVAEQAVDVIKHRYYDAVLQVYQYFKSRINE